jgi:hypothetical protein
MTQQQAAAVYSTVVVQQWHQAWCRALRTEQQEDCAALARPTPSLNARLAQPCLVEHGQQMLLGMHLLLCNYFEQACDSGWEVGLDGRCRSASGHKYSRKFL